jgi:hypothetical protein
MLCMLCCHVGEAEPVSLDENGKRVLQQGTCVWEERVQVDDKDVVRRCAGHAVWAQVMLGNALHAVSCAGVACQDWQHTALAG